MLPQDAVAGMPVQNKAIPDDNGIRGGCSAQAVVLLQNSGAGSCPETPGRF